MARILPSSFALRRTAKGTRIAVPGPRPRVNLHQIDAIGIQGAKTPLQLIPNVAFRESLVYGIVGTGRPIAGQHGRDLRGHVRTLARPLPQRLGDDLLASAVAVGAGRVDEIAAQLKHLVEGGHGFAVVLLPPVASSQGPSAHADFRHLPTGSSKSAVSHAIVLSVSWDRLATCPTYQTRSPACRIASSFPPAPA